MKDKRIVELRNIHKSFGDNHVLKGVDLDVTKGEVVVILGPSGSGKTTLLRTINFLDSADDGTVKIGKLEVDCKKHKKREIIELRRHTAMVFQNYNLFKNKTILQNLTIGMTKVRQVPSEMAKENATKLLENVGLGDKLNAYPIELSGGQQQRVGICRALSLNPDVILLDEPTSALDPELVGDILQIIKEVAQTGITMIVVTHEIAFAREVASRVIFMEGGNIVEQGSPSEILVNPKEERTKTFLSRITNPNGADSSTDISESSKKNEEIAINF